MGRWMGWDGRAYLGEGGGPIGIALVHRDALGEKPGAERGVAFWVERGGGMGKWMDGWMDGYVHWMAGEMVATPDLP